ncbi:MAG: Nif3-like dinuclear metal center hexameric protein [Microbacteriaceae bacterium]
MNDSKLFAQAVESIWPLSNADDWDAPGFSVSLHKEIRRVLLSVDVTGAVIAEAAEKNCDVLFTHHPLLLRGTNDANHDSLKGALIQSAIKRNVSIYSAHTNADVVEDGVSDTLAKAIGLLDTKPLVVAADESIGHGRIGRLPKAVPLKNFVAHLAEVLPFTARGIAATGNPEQLIQSVALCAGAGDAFIANAQASGADVYVTSDLRHHVALDATLSPSTSHFSLVDISHWAAESLWLEVAKKKLRQVLPGLEFEVSELVTDPWSFSINRGN